MFIPPLESLGQWINPKYGEVKSPPSLKARNICGEYLSLKCLHEVQLKPITVAKSTIQPVEYISWDVIWPPSLKVNTGLGMPGKGVENRSDRWCVLVCTTHTFMWVSDCEIVSHSCHFSRLTAFIFDLLDARPSSCLIYIVKPLSPD